MKNELGIEMKAKAEVNKFLVSTVCTILGVEEND